MSKSWQAYAKHIIDTITKIRDIEARGNLTEDVILFDAALRNLQTLSEATQLLPEELKENYTENSMARNQWVSQYPGSQLPR